MWIRASSALSIEEDVRGIITRLGIDSTGCSWAEVMQLFEAWLQDSKHREWLLILDDLNSTEGLDEQASKAKGPFSKTFADHLPVNDHGAILCISSRYAAARRLVGDGNDIIFVDAMSEKDTYRSRITTREHVYISQDSDITVRQVSEDKEAASNDNEEASNVRRLSSLVILGLEGRARAIDIFAKDLIQNLDCDYNIATEDRHSVVTTLQDALRTYSYSLEYRARPGQLGAERKAALFVRQQS
jgi:hypothetical protein